MALSVRSLPSILLVFLLLLVAFAAGAKGAQSVTLRWARNDEPDIAGYRLYYGKTSHSYRQYVDTSTTQATVSNLVEGTTYFFAATAFNTAGLESAYSDEVSYTVAPTPTPTPKPTPTPTPTPTPSQPRSQRRLRVPRRLRALHAAQAQRQARSQHPVRAHRRVRVPEKLSLVWPTFRAVPSSKRAILL